MLTFFRGIRQNLLNDGQLGKYLFYAVGEILLVVIGILIALQIDNWNNERQEKDERQQLIISLINDFEESSINIDSSLLIITPRREYMEFFIQKLVYSKEIHYLDSLKSNFFQNFFFTTVIDVVTTTYKNAESNGTIDLLNDKEIYYLFADYFAILSELKSYREVSLKKFYEGAYWEIAKEFGSVLNIVNRVNSTDNEPKEIISFLNQPKVSAALEMEFILTRNKERDALKLSQITNNILNRLYCLKNGTCPKN